jgi:pyridoxal phosphate enzyme (YggS family)
MSSITVNIETLLKELPEGVTVVAVSKTRSPDEIMEAYNAGQRIFGENRVLELMQKKEVLPADIHWHLIGHLQSNKVKQAVTAVSMIESVDTVRLLNLIDAESARQGKKTDCLLQVHIASEETKTGFTVDEVSENDWTAITASLKAVRVCGLMGMASFTGDTDIVRKEFRTLTTLFASLKETHFSRCSWFREISMGMSGDWRIAVEEGSTMIRVGTLIFGERTKQ